MGWFWAQESIKWIRIKRFLQQSSIYRIPHVWRWVWRSTPDNLESDLMYTHGIWKAVGKDSRSIGHLDHYPIWIYHNYALDYTKIDSLIQLYHVDPFSEPLVTQCDPPVHFHNISRTTYEWDQARVIIFVLHFSYKPSNQFSLHKTPDKLWTSSQSWFKWEPTGKNPTLGGQNPWFPVDFPWNQSIEPPKKDGPFPNEIPLCRMSVFFWLRLSLLRINHD